MKKQNFLQKIWDVIVEVFSTEEYVFYFILGLCVVFILYLMNNGLL
jgi:hypothetical protein